MRVLVLEDMMARLDWFRAMLIGCEVDYTHLVSEAIKLLETKEYDFIFLDHDLADEHYIHLFEGRELTPEELENTGTGLARWLGANPQRSSEAQIILHSCNEGGRKRMSSFLKGREVKEVPFPELMKKLRLNI